MKLIYGSGYDAVVPQEPGEGQALLGERAVGPLGLLEELELRLGCLGAAAAGVDETDNQEQHHHTYHQEYDQKQHQKNHQEYRHEHDQEHRFLHYLPALWKVSDAQPAPFYANSLKKAPFAVSEHLLSIRDSLTAGGFNFKYRDKYREGMPDRLRDFCRVEEALPAGSPVHEGYGDRVDAVVKKLEAGVYPVSLDEVIICEDYYLLPPAVKRIFDVMHAAHTNSVKLSYRLPEPQADACTDLGRIQRALMQESPKECEYTQDGSIIITRCATTVEALTLVARALRDSGNSCTGNNEGPGANQEEGLKNGSTTDSIVEAAAGSGAGPASRVAASVAASSAADPAENTALVVPKDIGLLNELLRADATPAVGAAGGVKKEPGPLSSLRLITALLWDPIDTEAFAGLLASSISPLPPFMGRSLIKIFQEYPGIDSPEWTKTYECSLERISDENQKKRVAQRYRRFLKGERYSRFSGAPADAIVGLFEDTAELLRARSKSTSHFSGSNASNDGTADADILAEGAEAAGFQVRIAGACEWVAGAVKTLFGKAAVPEHRLNRLVDYCISSFTPARKAARQAGSITAVTSPDQLGTPVDRLLWVPARETGTPADGFFSACESAWLEKQAVILDTPSLRAAGNFAASVSALCLARRQLIFTVIDDPGEEGDTAALVPVIEALAGCKEHHRIPLADTDFITNSAVLQRTAKITLPKRKNYWEISPDIFSRGRTESYSSLTDLFFYPYRYLLKYTAQLERSTLGALPEGPLFYGRLLHKFTEKYISQETTLGKDRVRHWLDSQYETLLAAYGLPLLETGNERHKERTRSVLQGALSLLVRLLSEAQTREIKIEHKGSGRLDGIPVTGFIDLFAESDSGPMIIDFKWGGLKTRREEVEEGRDMQLAIYALLVHAVERGPNTAYLIAHNGVAVTHPGSCFKSAETPAEALPTGEAYPPLLKAMAETAKYRYNQLETGSVALSPEDTRETLPNSLIKLPESPHKYDEYRNLLGRHCPEWSDT